MTIRPAISLLALALALAVAPSRADACSVAHCVATTFLPQSHAGAALPSLPENGATIALVTRGGSALSSEITASRLRGGARTEVTLVADGSTVTLPDALEGDEWTIVEAHTCETGAEASSETTVRIGP